MPKIRVSKEQQVSASVGTPTSGVEAGHTPEMALPIGALQGGASVTGSGSVGGEDPADLYQFSVDGNQNVSITLNTLEGDADLALFDSQMNLIASSAQPGLELDQVMGDLGPGTYYVGVVPYQGAPSQYEFELQVGGTAPGPVSPTPVPGPGVEAGHTPEMALPIGALQGGASVTGSGSVGGEDPADLYQFSVDGNQNVSITLNTLEGDADLALFDSQMNLIASSAQPGLELDQVMGDLGPGTYYVGVVPYQGAPSQYEFELQVGGTAPGPVSPAPVPGPVPMPPVSGPAPGVSAASAAALPESLALRDQVGLAAASGGSEKFMGRRNPLLTEQMLAVG
jgi:Bacterial pre-peptidase C-terminal domain